MNKWWKWIFLFSFLVLHWNKNHAHKTRKNYPAHAENTYFWIIKGHSLWAVTKYNLDRMIYIIYIWSFFRIRSVEPGLWAFKYRQFSFNHPVFEVCWRLQTFRTLRVNSSIFQKLFVAIAFLEKWYIFIQNHI